MSIYLDANVLVGLFTIDALSQKIQNALRSSIDILLISDFAAAEFSAAVSSRMRERALSVEQAQAAFANFDAWTEANGSRVETQSADIVAAQRLIRRLDSPLRAPDALHIALTSRVGARLLTFDKQMAQAARRYDIKLVGT